MDNKEGNILFGKIVISIMIVLFSFISYIVLYYFAHFDDNWNTIIVSISLISIVFLLLLSVWKSKYKKKCYIISLILFIIIIINCIYFAFFSMKLEPLLHLHKKYNIDYSDMEIIESHNYGRYDFFGNNYQLREAKIKHDDYIITVEYLHGWKDDYNDQLIHNSNNQMFTKSFNSMLKTFTEDYIFYEKPIIDDSVYYDPYNYTIYYYNIYLYCTEEENLTKLIEMLDNYILSNNTVSINYNLNIIKDQELYNQIKSSNIEKDIVVEFMLKKMGYTTKVYRDSSIYDKTLFIDNGDSHGFKKSKDYKYVVFFYSSHLNKYSSTTKPDTDFRLIGVNEKGTQE